MPTIIREGDKCPDCGKELILTLTCSDDDCGTTINPKDGYKILRREDVSMIPAKIVTAEYKRKGQHIGWKVYINGEKFPKKPVECYLDTEENAIRFALLEYRKEKGIGP